MWLNKWIQRDSLDHDIIIPKLDEANPTSSDQYAAVRRIWHRFPRVEVSASMATASCSQHQVHETEAFHNERLCDLTLI